MTWKSRITQRKRTLVPTLSVAAAGIVTLMIVGPGALPASAASGRSGHVASGSSTHGMKTGWVYDGSITDKGYDQAFYEAQKTLEKTLGITAKISTETPYTSVWTTTDESMAAAGAKMLFDPGDGGSLFYKACAAYPKVACVETNGVKPFPKNVDSVYFANWLTSYLEGEAAGLLTKTGTIGFLAAFENVPAPVNGDVNALTLGCQATHPGCKTLVDVVTSWYTPPKETEDMNALADAGADVLDTTENDPISIEVAQKHHLWGIGQFGTGDRNSPAFVTSADLNWTPILSKLTKQVAAHTFKGNQILINNFGPGLSLAKWGTRVPKNVRSKVDATQKQMDHGKNFFCGPIRDTAGALKVPKGKCLSSSFLYDQWSWYVKGVHISK